MLFSTLSKIWKGVDKPFFTGRGGSLRFNQLEAISIEGLERINEGDVVALVGDFEPESIATLLTLIDRKCIVVPLTQETESQHPYFFEQAKVQAVFHRNKLKTIVDDKQISHPLLDQVRYLDHPGIILFTTGSTGRPKAILHDFMPFVARYATPRPSLRALSFLLFDHIGGINTLLHMLYNQGTVVSIKSRTVQETLRVCRDNEIELLPTTPTFLRLLSYCSGLRQEFPSSVKIISYGTERMDQPTLDYLCKELPNVDFRQTYGMSELGILRIKSFAKDSLYMKVGGEGVVTKVIDSLLYIRSENRMLGYLNAPSPFDDAGWYCTKDIVDICDDGFLRVTGRDSDVINVGGLKFMPSEVERAALLYPGVKFAKAVGKENPITGQHVELLIEEVYSDVVDITNLRKLLATTLPRHMQPSSIKKQPAVVSHRFKKL